MSFIVVDVESDGPIIGEHSLVCFGAVIVDQKLDKTFYGQIKPIGLKYDQEALAVSGFTRQQHEKFDDPVIVIKKFADWIKVNSVDRPILISDNNGYDASWINYYFHKFYGKNPFGFSSRRIGDLYAGFVNDASHTSAWKKLRKTKHTHNPVDDAKGNAEALLKLKEMGLNIEF